MFLAYKNAIPMLDLVLVGGCDDLYDRLKIFTKKTLKIFSIGGKADFFRDLLICYKAMFLPACILL